MSTRTTRIGLALLGAGVLALGLSGPAGAHVTVDRDEVPAGGYTQVTLTVPHGCEDSPTRQLAVQIPEGILNAAPQVVAGWDVETTISELAEPIEGGHGEAQTERVSEITWTAQPGNELPSPFRQTFTIGFKAPDTVGQTLAFAAVQTCPDGEVAWIEETSADGEEPDHPAPFVVVGEAQGEGHGSSDAGDDADGAGEAPAGDGEEATAPVGEATSGDSDGGTDGVAVGGLVLGALGLAAGGTALLRTRSTS